MFLSETPSCDQQEGLKEDQEPPFALEVVTRPRAEACDNGLRARIPLAVGAALCPAAC